MQIATTLLSFLTFQSKIFLQVLDEIMFWNLNHMLSLAWERLLTFLKYIKQGVSCCLKIFWVYLLMWALCEQGALLEPVFESGGSARSQFSSGELASCPTQYSSTEQKNIDVHRRKELNMHFKSVNKMCHFISIWELVRIRHSSFYWHTDISHGQKKKKKDRMS